jgi:2,3-dihydroxyphenylpropionate 1,2-dioxygenase
MPPFCIGTAAQGVGDYGTYAGPLDVPEEIATDCAKAVLESGVDVAISASMDVDHGTVQPLQKLFGDATARPVLPVFINSVATPLGPLRRVRALGAAVGAHLGTLGKRVLIVGSGGLSHDPPVPTLATAPPAALDRIVHGNPMTPEQRQARQVAVMEAAREFAGGQGSLQPLNPDWDHAFLELLDSNRLADVDAWSNAWIEKEAGHSAHEIRTWVAAFAALAAHGPYKTQHRFYRAAPELIAGFAIRTAVLDV